MNGRVSQASVIACHFTIHNFRERSQQLLVYRGTAHIAAVMDGIIGR
jgi:hypothetical protein